MRIAQRLLMSDKNSSPTRICLTLQVPVLEILGSKPTGVDLVFVDVWQKNGAPKEKQVLKANAFPAPTHIPSSQAVQRLTHRSERPSLQWRTAPTRALPCKRKAQSPSCRKRWKEREWEWDIRTLGFSVTSTFMDSLNQEQLYMFISDHSSFRLFLISSETFKPQQWALNVKSPTAGQPKIIQQMRLYAST